MSVNKQPEIDWNIQWNRCRWEENCVKKHQFRTMLNTFTWFQRPGFYFNDRFLSELAPCTATAAAAAASEQYCIKSFSALEWLAWLQTGAQIKVEMLLLSTRGHARRLKGRKRQTVKAPFRTRHQPASDTLPDSRHSEPTRALGVWRYKYNCVPWGKRPYFSLFWVTSARLLVTAASPLLFSVLRPWKEFQGP